MTVSYGLHQISIASFGFNESNPKSSIRGQRKSHKNDKPIIRIKIYKTAYLWINLSLCDPVKNTRHSAAITSLFFLYQNQIYYQILNAPININWYNFSIKEIKDNHSSPNKKKIKDV